MARWQADSADRLGEAALELFAERGFDQATVADIAARAGLTERTFFRHYPDKREVLFGGSAGLQQLLVDAVAAAPPDASPIEAVVVALESAGALLQERRGHARQRHAVIVANTELKERELIKLASLATAMAAALRERGAPPTAAALTGEAGIAVFHVAFEKWVTGSDEIDLPQCIRTTLDELRGVTA